MGFGNRELYRTLIGAIRKKREWNTRSESASVTQIKHGEVENAQVANSLVELNLHIALFLE